MSCFVARFTRVSLSLAALLLAPVARAEITPDAKAVVDRFLEAVGGAAAIHGVQSTHTKATITAFGLKGTTEVYTRRPDRRATVTEIGPFKISEGSDGTTAWRTDPGTGKLVILDGKDLEDAHASAYFDNELWLLPDQGGGKVTLVGNEQDSTGTYTVIEVTPPVGRPRLMYVNLQTGLVDRASTRRDQLAITTTLSDYRRVEGRMVPFGQLTQITGMPANDLGLAVDTVWTNKTLPDSLFLPPGHAGSAVTYLKTPGVARLPFQGGRHVWLKASVNGHEPANFIFDTGASLTVIDSAYAAKIGLERIGEMSAQGAGAGGGASLSTLKSLRVAAPDGDGVEVQDAKIALLSINAFLAPFFWRDCAGVLGYDFISRFVTELDFDTKTITLHDPKQFKYEGHGERIPFKLAGTMPVIEMKIDGKYTGGFRVDVGSGATVDLHAPFVKQHDLANTLKGGVEVTGGGFGGTFKNQLVRMKKIEIAQYSWENPLVSLSMTEVGAFSSEDYAGNIGTQILDRFRCYFDYDRRELILEPGEKYAKKDEFSRAGVQLARFGDAVKAMEVLEGSPAAKAGFKAGDEVVTFEGKPILSYTSEEVQERLTSGKPGSKVAFEIARDGKRQKLTVTLRDII